MLAKPDVTECKQLKTTLPAIRDSDNGEIEYLASFATGGHGGQAGDEIGQERSDQADIAGAPLGASGEM